MSESLHVLLVDDEAAIRRILGNELRSNGLEVDTAESAAQARQWLGSHTPDVIVLDVRMPGMSGDVFLRELPTLSPNVPVIILTGHANVDLAVQCMKDGASDLITKPCSVEHLEMAIRRAAETQHLREANRTLMKYARSVAEAPARMIGSSGKMKRLFEMIDRVAMTDEPVLIIGESGTGKELIAREIQEKSRRAKKPFLTVNCAAVTETLLESELFGHEKGAFSGADERRLGFFELAHEGTLFLDEIGDMPLTMQPKLLRVLQSGEFRRVGGNKTLHADVRIIAATNKSLIDEVREGRFREDLMHRVNTIILESPPLRVRIEDMDESVDFFLKEIEPGASTRHEFAPETLERMRAYDWPGNVRELRNVVRRAVILCPDSTITPDYLPSHLLRPRGEQENLHTPSSSSFLDRTLAEMERQHIIAVLEDCQGNKTQAAKRLGVSVKTLYNKFEAWGIESESP